MPSLPDFTADVQDTPAFSMVYLVRSGVRRRRPCCFLTTCSALWSKAQKFTRASFVVLAAAPVCLIVRIVYGSGDFLADVKRRPLPSAMGVTDTLEDRLSAIQTLHVAPAACRAIPSWSLSLSLSL